MLDPSFARAVAERFGLGPGARLRGPVAFGRQGEIWRLDTEQGSFAVKQWRVVPEADEVERDAAYQDRVHAAGIPMPAVVRDTRGRALSEADGVPVRAYGWVDVATEDRHLDPVVMGRVLAAIHAVHVPASGPVEAWHAAPVGAGAWEDLVDRLSAAGAGFAGQLAGLLPALAEVEGLLSPPTELQVCHRDLWADNVRATPGSGMVVLDWENCGPASPSHELAMVAYEYGLGDASRIRALHRAYAEAGGPGRLRDPADATMLVAQQLHVLQVACERWLASGTDAERADNAAWAAEFLDDPVTVPVVERMLVAVR